MRDDVCGDLVSGVDVRIQLPRVICPIDQCNASKLAHFDSL